MDSFMDICIQDGKLTAAGERACQMAYGHITGEPKYTNEAHVMVHKNKANHLAFSLDAWMPLWKAMGDELMAELFGMRVVNSHLLDPMWWLEASLRACGLHEKWRADNEQG